ncbi:MAG: hypothetical protein WA060_01415 [Minisyncoccia bacterium]
MKKFFTSIWSIWIGSTLLYLLMFFLRVDPLRPLVMFVGLFVPFGIWNTIASLSQPLSLIVGIGSIGLAGYLIRRSEIEGTIRIFAALVSLVIITFLVDMLLWHQWCSWEVLMQTKNAACGLGGF